MGGPSARRGKAALTCLVAAAFVVAVAAAAEGIDLAQFAKAVAKINDYIVSGDGVDETWFKRVVKHLPETDSGAELETVEGYPAFRDAFAKGHASLKLNRELRFAVLVKLGDGAGVTTLLDGAEFPDFREVLSLMARIDAMRGGPGVPCDGVPVTVGRDRRYLVADALRASSSFAERIGLSGKDMAAAMENYTELETYFSGWPGWEELRDFLVRGKDIGIAIENPISPETLAAWLSDKPVALSTFRELQPLAPKIETPEPLYAWLSAFGSTRYGADGTLLSKGAFASRACFEELASVGAALSRLFADSGSGRGGSRPKKRHDPAVLRARLDAGMEARLAGPPTGAPTAPPESGTVSANADFSAGAALELRLALGDEVDGFVSRNASRLVGAALFPDAGPSALQDELDALLRRPEIVKLLLAQLSRGLYPPAQRTLYRRFFEGVVGSWDGKAPARGDAGFVAPGEPATTVGAQFLAFFLSYHRDVETTAFVRYSDALWRAFDFGPDGAKLEAFAAFLADTAERLELSGFMTDEALAFLAERIFRGPWEDGSAGARLFLHLVENRYVKPDVPASEKNRILTKTVPALEAIRDANARDAFGPFREFYAGYAARLAERVAAPDFDAWSDFRTRAALCELAPAFANANPGVVPASVGWALGRYRLFDPFVAERKLEEETVEKEFFGERRHAPPAGLDYRFLSDGTTAAPPDRDDKAEETLALVAKGALRRISALRDPVASRSCMEATVSVMRAVPGGEGGIETLVGGQKPKLLARRAFEYAMILLGGEQGYDPEEFAAGSEEEVVGKLSRLLGVAVAIDGKPVAARMKELRDQAAALPAGESEARATCVRDFVGLVAGLEDFMYKLATPELAASIRETALILDDAGAYAAVVKALVKIVYYHPDPRVSTLVAAEFVKLFGGAGAIPPELYGDYARICFFSFRDDRKLLADAFDNLYRRYRESPERGGHYVEAMLVFADDPRMREGIAKVLAEDPGFRASIGFTPEESLFVYRVLGPADYAALAAKPEFRDAFLADFVAFAPAVKKVFEDCWRRLRADQADATARAIDARVRELVAECYDAWSVSMKGLAHFSRRGELDQKTADAARETGAALFGFFVNEARVLSGEFLDSDIFYFPRPMRKFIDAPAAWERAVEAARPIGGAASWFDFLADGMAFYFGLEPRFGVRDFASGLVYANHAIYVATRAIIDLERAGKREEADRVWNGKVVAGIFDPVLRGRIFDGRDYSYEKYDGLRNIRFASGSRYDGTHFLLESLYVSWIREELGALQPIMARRFTAMMATFFESAVRGISVDYSQAFLDKTLLPLFLRTVEGGKFDYGPVAGGIYPKQEDFFADPCKPLYVDRRFNYGRYNYLWNLRGGDRLKESLSAWYRFAPDNARFFELMPALILRDEQLTAGTRRNGNFDPARASWGFYLHRIDVPVSEEERTSISVPGFLRFPGNVNEVVLLSDPVEPAPPGEAEAPPEGTAPDLAPEGAAPADETAEPPETATEQGDAPRWAIAAPNATSSVRYEFTYLQNDRSGTAVSTAGIASGSGGAGDLGAYLAGVVFAPGDAVYRNLKRNADLVVAAPGAAADPASLTLFSEGRWLRVDAERFRMDGFTSMDDVFSLNGTVDRTDALSAFAGARRVPLAKNPVIALDRKKTFDTVYFAAIEKKGQLGLVELAAAGSKFRFVFRRLEGASEAECWPIEIVTEGYNSVKFRFSRFGTKKAPPPVEDVAISFAIVRSDADSAVPDAFCVGVDPATGRVRTWEKLVGVKTEIAFDAPLPKETKAVIVRDKVLPKREYPGWLKPGSTDADSGRLVGGAVAIQPELFAALDRAGLSAMPASRNVFVRYAVPEDPRGRSAFVTATAGRYAVTPAYGDVYFLGIFNRFIMYESAERYRREIGEAVSRWYAFDGFGGGK